MTAMPRGTADVFAARMGGVDPWAMLADRAEGRLRRAIDAFAHEHPAAREQVEAAERPRDHPAAARLRATSGRALADLARLRGHDGAMTAMSAAMEAAEVDPAAGWRLAAAGLLFTAGDRDPDPVDAPRRPPRHG